MMSIRMATPWLCGSIYGFRKDVPKDLCLILKKTEEKFSLETRDPREAKIKFAIALTES
jgi:hypothetical protein